MVSGRCEVCDGGSDLFIWNGEHRICKWCFEGIEFGVKWGYLMYTPADPLWVHYPESPESPIGDWFKTFADDI